MPTVPNAGNESEADKQIARALRLERERADLQGRIAKNREYLRLMDENESLTEEQGKWLDEFYPLKEKGERRSKEAIEATRKAKQAAQKHGDKDAAAAAV